MGEVGMAWQHDMYPRNEFRSPGFEGGSNPAALLLRGFDSQATDDTLDITYHISQHKAEDNQ